MRLYEYDEGFCTIWLFMVQSQVLVVQLSIKHIHGNCRCYRLLDNGRKVVLALFSSICVCEQGGHLLFSLKRARLA